MTALKAVIGANFGDEGKGLVTDYLCGEALKENKNCLVICTNGGAQRGHTVELEDGRRFVFHHLGAGTLLGVGSFFCADFILNPMLFSSDWNELWELTNDDKALQQPELFMDRNCRFTTPYDMFTNQIIEDARGNKRHGSVGVGIWETVRRYEKGKGITIHEFMDMPYRKKKEFLHMVRDYARDRIYQKLHIYPEKIAGWENIWTSDMIITNYIEDCYHMFNLVRFCTIQELEAYDILIAENAQGILLGQNRYDGTNNTTPSDTGAKEIRRLLDAGLREIVTKTDLYYVSRTYVTKHGAGDFPGECDRMEISPAIYDLTNVPNAYQGTIRYGRLDPIALHRQLVEDMNDMDEYEFHPNLVLTHTNEAPYEGIVDAFHECDKENVQAWTFYTSDGHTRNTVKVL